jgi:hypothetical protein
VVRVTVLKAAVDCFHKNQLLMALKLNLDSCWGIAEITGPYLWTLSYSSNKGTASSFKFLGTAKYCFSDKGTTKSFLHSWKHIHKMEDSITGCDITSICMCPQKSDHLCLLGANIRVEPSQNERAQMTFCFLSCTNIWK